MRTRTILTALSLALACGAPVVGCQIIAGLTALEVSDAGADGGPLRCVPNTPCGGKCLGSTMVAPATCDDTGTCPGQPTPCPTHYGCNTDGTACNMGSCTSSSDCATDSVCIPTGMGMGMGTGECAACGELPGMMPCAADAGSICETCSNDGTGTVCIKTCDTPGECTGNLMAGAPQLVRIQCNGQCNNTTITCQGPNPCEIDCGTNGCNGLTINCSTTGGVCTLKCDPGGCKGGVTMNCGDNACVAQCAPSGGAVVHQVADKSCGLTKMGCP